MRLAKARSDLGHCEIHASPPFENSVVLGAVGVDYHLNLYVLYEYTAYATISWVLVF